MAQRSSLLGITVLVCSLVACLPRMGIAQPAFLPTETAILTGVLNNGDTIPLPAFANGDSATEAQCKWFVSTNSLWMQGCPAQCYTEGRVVRVYTCNTYGTANFMIIATRALQAPSFPPGGKKIVAAPGYAWEGSYAIDSDGDVYSWGQPQCTPSRFASRVGNMFGGTPPSARIVQGNVDNGLFAVVLENGDIWQWCPGSPGEGSLRGNIFSESGITGISAPQQVPLASMGLARPNPFNPTTEISYSISEVGEVVGEVFDINGRRVRTLVQASLPPGIHRTVWDGTTAGGTQAASGIYFFRLQLPGGRAETQKITLLR